MRTDVCAFLDEDRIYASRMAEFLQSGKNLPFRVVPFTNAEELLSFGRREHVDILLTGHPDWRRIAGELQCRSCFVLTEMSEEQKGGGRDSGPEDAFRAQDEEEDTGENEEEPGGCRVCFIERYQPADTILERLLDAMAELDRHTAPDPAERNGAVLPVSAVFSPVGRCGKTSFAVTLGEVLAVKKRVLYLNLEDYHGFEGINAAGGRTGSDLSDLLYYMRQDEGGLVYRLSSMVQTWNRLDYIEPAFSSFDLKDAGTAEWIRLLQILLESGNYERIILDMGSRSEEMFCVLRACDHIYVPVLDDLFSRAKVSQFMKNLEVSGEREILQRMVRLHLPAWQEETMAADFPRQLLRGKYTRYVQQLTARESVAERPHGYMGEAYGSAYRS